MASLSFLARRRDLPKNILNQYNYHRVIAPRWPYGAESSGASISSYNIVNQNNHNMCSMLQSSPYSTYQNQLLTTINSSKTLSSSSQQQQRRSLFIQTSETPNPESLKFIPNGRLVLGHKSDDVDIDDTQMNEDGEGIELEDNTSDVDNNNSNNNDTKGVYLTRKDHTLIARSPLAKLLFNLDLGIKSIYLGYDFITGKVFFITSFVGSFDILCDGRYVCV